MTTLTTPRRTWYVDRLRGYARRTGHSEGRGFDDIGDALAVANPGDIIDVYPYPSGYDEAVTIAATLYGLRLRGIGARGSVFIKPSASNARALTNHADDISLENIGMEGNGTGGGLENTGKRLRARAAKIEGGANPLLLTLGTVLQIAAGSKGKGDDAIFDDCEVCWGTTGVILKGTDYGAVTQPRFRKSRFHNLTAAAFEETFLTGGAVSLQYRNLLVEDSAFENGEDGTVPTKFFSLNDSNSNTGLVKGCSFPVALNSGKNLVSTGLIWSGNLHPAGLSTGQPS